MKSVDVVVPVYNEEAVLEQSVATLRQYLAENVSWQWRIVIADNASVDNTLGIARELAGKHPDVAYVHLDLKGRGRALKKAWLESDADAVSYMDVDLSTKLDAFPQLLQAFDEGYDLAIGSRLTKGSKVIGRSLKRETTSRVYNMLIRIMFYQSFHDAQCGFKALTREVAQDIVPLAQDNTWFFDTEVLLLAERRGYRIKEVPVEWVDDPDSRVDVAKTAMDDIKGLLRVRFRPPF